MLTPTPDQKNLRKGRYSQQGQAYHVTTATKDRNPLFLDMRNARILINVMHRQPDARTLAYVVMPDHLHWLLQLLGDADLSRTVQSIKSISAHEIGRPIWQSSFYDHALRKDEDMQSLARYIIANPLRAGLVNRIGDYPHWDAIWL